MIGALEDVGIGYDQQNAFGRTFHQAALGFEHGDARALRTDQRPRYVKSALRQEIIQVVAGDSARNVGITLTNEIAVRGGNCFQPGIDLAAPSAQVNEAFQFVAGSGSDSHSAAIVGEDVEGLDVVIGTSRHYPM